MAYEAMNNAGSMNANLIVVNDNDMSIAPPVGAGAYYQDFCLEKLIKQQGH